MRREVADAIVEFCRRIDEGLRVMCEARQCAAIFLTLELFGMLTCFGIVQLESVVCPCKKEELAGVVKVD